MTEVNTSPWRLLLLLLLLLSPEGRGGDLGGCLASLGTSLDQLSWRFQPCRRHFLPVYLQEGERGQHLARCGSTHTWPGVAPPTQLPAALQLLPGACYWSELEDQWVQADPESVPASVAGLELPTCLCVIQT